MNKGYIDFDSYDLKISAAGKGKLSVFRVLLVCLNVRCSKTTVMEVNRATFTVRTGALS